MALIACPECGRQVSHHAQACPECGYPIASDASIAIMVASATNPDKVEVEFSRPTYFHAKMNGTVYVDEEKLGEIEACSSFRVSLLPGQHHLAIESMEHGVFRQKDCVVDSELNIPRGVKLVRVRLQVQEGLKKLMNGGKCLVVASVDYER